MNDRLEIASRILAQEVTAKVNKSLAQWALDWADTLIEAERNTRPEVKPISNWSGGDENCPHWAWKYRTDGAIYCECGALWNLVDITPPYPHERDK